MEKEAREAHPLNRKIALSDDASPPGVISIVAALVAKALPGAYGMCDAGVVGRLLLLFILVPAVELALLIELGQAIGTAATIGLIVVTGIVGASLARHQGLRVITKVQSELAEQQLPTSSLMDGLMIIVASALLVTPGVLTDVVGFLCLLPAFRNWVKRQLMRHFETAIRTQRLNVHVHDLSGSGFGSPPSQFREEIDVTPRSTKRTDDAG